MTVQTPDPARVDPLIQLILAVAGQQDELRDRELGPIHVLKYAYLADVAHADAHGGETFTGAQWQFYDFGPWSPALLHRIEPAAAGVGAERKIVRGERYGDFTRYSLHDEQLLDRLDHQLPNSVVSTIRWAVREFGTDTPALLRHVYMTRPMLCAAPGEYLTFEHGADVVAEPRGAESANESPKLTRQRRKIAEHLRTEVRRRLADRPAATEAPSPAPRYDDVFFDGVAWLDEQAGDPVPLAQGELVFSPDIWKSRGRGESGGDAT